MSMRRLAAVTVVFLAATAHAAGEPMRAEGALPRIDRAYEEGRIDEATHALLGFRLARFPQTLPEEFRPADDETPIRCGTLLARRAFRMAKAGAFDEAQTADFALLGGRPVMTDFVTVPTGSLNPFARVHYNSAMVTPALAQQIADYLAESWTAEFVTMGWRVPPPDVGNGGGSGPDPDVTLDLYLDPSEFGAVTVPIQEDTCGVSWACTASFIILEPNVLNVETYVAHELNHSSQFAYDYADGDFIYEATATWMEDKVYDIVNDYVFFVSDFQKKPERTLSYSSDNDSYMYGGAVFVHYLADVYDGGGTTLVRDVWDAMKPSSADWYDAVATEMSSEGFADFTDVYTEFAGVRMLTGARDDGTLEEGEEMTGVEIEASFDYASVESGETSNPPQGLGANYLLVVTAGAEEGDALTLHVSSNEPGPWFITAIGMPAAGAATITVFPDDDDNGKLEATIPDVSPFAQIGFAVTSAANANDGVDSQFGAGGHSVDLTTHPFRWNFGGGGDDAVGCGCQIPAGRRAPSALSVITVLLAVAGSIVLRRRRS